MNRIKNILKNRWVGFALATTLYLLWFVIWLGNAWFLLGVPIIYDLYISRLFYRYVWSKNERLCEISSLYRNIYEWVNAIVFATVVASLIHIFFFQMYVIPSSSMEKSLLVSDKSSLITKRVPTLHLRAGLVKTSQSVRFFLFNSKTSTLPPCSVLAKSLAGQYNSKTKPALQAIR